MVPAFAVEADSDLNNLAINTANLSLIYHLRYLVHFSEGRQKCLAGGMNNS